MSSLYRRYRPNQFSEVVGQEHVRTSLESSFKKGLVAHAYLFAGPRGTGKTTMARLLARTINCTKRGKKSEACGKCQACQEILNGMAVDIIEIDAASNRGIDEMRELRDKIGYAPSLCKYRVYIIDEVHMLTKEAFNALLKTLEEPPAHAVFVLATTEQHKLPDTIISRCQRYQFHRATPEKLSILIEQVAAKEGIDLTSDGASLLSERADGSYRDALTLLGSVSSHSHQLDAPTLRKLLGLPAVEAIESFQQFLQAGQTANLNQLIRDLLNEGYDISVIVKTLADRLRDQILAGELSVNESERAARLLEQALLTLTRARNSSDPTGIIVARILNIASEISPTLAVPTNTKDSTTPAQSVTDIRQPKETTEDDATTNTVDGVNSQSVDHVAGQDDFWPAFLQEIKKSNHALYMLVRTAKLLELSKEKILLAVKFRFYSERLFEIKNRKLVETAASQVVGRPIRLECQVMADLEEPSRSGEDEMLNAVVDVFELEEVAS